MRAREGEALEAATSIRISLKTPGGFIRIGLAVAGGFLLHRRQGHRRLAVGTAAVRVGRAQDPIGAGADDRLACSSIAIVVALILIVLAVGAGRC